MLVFAAALIGAFIFWAVLFAEEIDDDNDGPGGGTMIPVMVPTQ